MVLTEAPALESNNLMAPSCVEWSRGGNSQNYDGGGSALVLRRTSARASFAHNNLHPRSKCSRRQRRPDNSRSGLRGPARLELRFRQQRGLRESHHHPKSGITNRQSETLSRARVSFPSNWMFNVGCSMSGSIL